MARRSEADKAIDKAKRDSGYKSFDPKKTPAKPSERKKGSKKNKPGSAASSGGKITFSEKTLKTLKKKADDSKYTLGQLKAVYRRGAGAFSSSHHPKANRHSWAMGRVNSFIRGGHPQDNDLK